MDHVLSELSAMTHHSVAHSFTELLKPLGNDKAVILEGGSDANRRLIGKVSDAGKD